jgi:hypothetical protein
LLFIGLQSLFASSSRARRAVARKRAVTPMPVIESTMAADLSGQ